MFYTYNQNNSYGIMIKNDKICSCVIIEEKTLEEATIKAESLGIYLNGINDCPCCGYRWTSPDISSHLIIPDKADYIVYFENSTIEKYTFEYPITPLTTYSNWFKVDKAFENYLFGSNTYSWRAQLRFCLK